MATQQATQDLRARLNKCHLKAGGGRGSIDGLQIIFATNSTFVQSVVVDATLTKQDGRPLDTARTRSWTVRFKGQNGEVTAGENSGEAFQVFVPISRDDFTIMQFNNLDDQEQPSSTYTIHLVLKKGVNFKVQTRGQGMKLDVWELICIENSMMYRRRRFIQEECSHIKIIVPNYKKIDLDPIFEEDTIRRCLHQELLSDVTIIPNHFIRLQKLAIRAEEQHQTNALEQLKRKGVRLHFKELPGYQNRWYVELHPPPGPKWMFEGQERIILQVETDNTDQGGILALPPTRTPGRRDTTYWRATVFFVEGLHCGAINNVIDSPMLRDLLRTRPRIAGVSVGFEEDEDPNVSRMWQAMERLEDIMRLATETGYRPQRDIRVQHHIPPLGVFMSGHRGRMKRDVPEISFTSAQFQAFSNGPYQLDRPTHRTAIENAWSSKCGISLIQGPPATGKTELVSKIIGLTIKHTQLARGDSVVLAAHTNVAVHVAASRFVKHCKEMFHLDKNIACLVSTENKSEWGRLVGKDVDKNLADITLDAHLLRAASANKDKYKGFFDGLKQMQATGRIESMGLRKKYQGDVFELIGIVKSKVRVWFCTLATFHARNIVFGWDAGSGIQCGLLIIDEASQAHSAAAWMPWDIINPRRIVLAGDHQQLAPHVRSTEAQWAWKASLFEQLRIDQTANVPNVVLDLQFRTTRNIYAGTNVFYNGVVQSNQNTVGRQLYQALMNAVPRISFVDARGQKFTLSKNTHWFDMQNGQVTISGESGSSTNALERRFLISLFAALQICGIPADQCMLLTGYQAMHDDLKEDINRLPRPGTQVKKVDSAQGDEAGIVGLAMVRTAASGLGFMSQPRRQNVMTSRARDGMFCVGQWQAIDHAASQGNTAWRKWFQGMFDTNGGRWRIQFHSPVVFSVDGKVVDMSVVRPGDDAPPPPPTVIGMTESMVEEEAGEGSRRSSQSVQGSPSGVRSPNVPPGVQSPGLRGSQSPVGPPGTSSPTGPPGRRSLSLTLRPGTPAGSPPGSVFNPSSASPRSPTGPPSVGRAPTPGPRSPSVASFGSPGREQSQRQTSLDVSGSGHNRRSSLLNPQHGRTTGSGSVQLPFRPADDPDTPYYANPRLESMIKRIMLQSTIALKDTIIERMRWAKNDRFRNAYQRFQRGVNGLCQARLNNDANRFNQLMTDLQDPQLTESDLNNFAALAIALVRYKNLTGQVITWE